jgi:hypothetical protein
VLEGTFHETIGAPWTEMTPVTIGELPPGTGTPSIYVTVVRDGSPMLRLDVHEREPAVHAFQEVIGWRDFIVVGFGAHVHFVSPSTLRARSFRLGGYFGHLYALEERLLVADAERLHCFDQDGERIWRSPELGIDGVIVHGVSDGVIEGDAEHDPPGGWRPFRILVSSGAFTTQPT